jgi:hypothetical protein
MFTSAFGSALRRKRKRSFKEAHPKSNLTFHCSFSIKHHQIHPNPGSRRIAHEEEEEEEEEVIRIALGVLRREDRQD